MNATELYDSKLVEPLRIKILELYNSIEQLHNKLKNTVQEEYGHQSFNSNKKLTSYWKLVAYRDCLNRLQLFLEQNFNYIESMSLLAVTRYIFELTVWIKLMQKDEKYGYEYYYQLMIEKLNYLKRLKEHLLYEIEFLKMVAREKYHLQDRQLPKIQKISDLELQGKVLSQILRDIKQQIAEKASRELSIYNEEAQINGYSFQADLVETKILPDIEKSISNVDTELNQFNHDISTDIQISVAKKWNWKDKAACVNMEHEYNLIYSYTSKLLHANPMSLTPNQQNLEVSEVRMFVKYIYVRLLNVIEITEELLLTREANK